MGRKKAVKRTHVISPEPEKLVAGTIIQYYRDGYRVGKVVSANKKWVRVEILGQDPRTTRIKRFLSSEVSRDRPQQWPDSLTSNPRKVGGNGQ